MRSNTWNASFPYEARIQYAADCRRDEETATRLAAMHSRILADLRCAIALNIEAFIGAPGGRAGVTLTCHNRAPRGFVVSRIDDGIHTRQFAVDIKAGALRCRYRIGGGSSNRVSDHRELAMHIENDGSALSLWEGGLHRTFAGVDVVSVFLLAPMLDEASVNPETSVD